MLINVIFLYYQKNVDMIQNDIVIIQTAKMNLFWCYGLQQVFCGRGWLERPHRAECKAQRRECWLHNGAKGWRGVDIYRWHFELKLENLKTDHQSSRRLKPQERKVQGLFWILCHIWKIVLIFHNIFGNATVSFLNWK